ncbi:hypothetical protein [Pseudophaeobacter sp.]|uniref:hypothetical protein n=1 Tax=Pseudophaeobacter sp. TaxID=1971739 RepID=UPI003298950A
MKINAVKTPTQRSVPNTASPSKVLSLGKSSKQLSWEIFENDFPEEITFNLDATKLENQKVLRVRNHQNFLQKNSNKNFSAKVAKKRAQTLV